MGEILHSSIDVSNEPSIKEDIESIFEIFHLILCREKAPIFRLISRDIFHLIYGSEILGPLLSNFAAVMEIHTSLKNVINDIYLGKYFNSQSLVNKDFSNV